MDREDLNYIEQGLLATNEIEEALSPNENIPTKTGKAYKVFKVKNGKLYPPMVANQGGKDTPIGVWLDAEEGEFAGLSKTGRPQVKSTGSGNLAYRPGWHLGDIPRAKQFDRLNKETGEYEFPKDFVWAECEYAMDIDYQPEADEQGYMRTKVDDNGNVTTYKSDKYQHSLAGLKKLPVKGFYKYRTNPNPDTVPWVITGQIKVDKLLDDYQVNEILKQNGIEPIHRQGGDKTLKELGLQESFKEDLTQDEQIQLEEIDNLINDLYSLRQKSIQEEGEFGIGNLVFKEFRNLGYLDNLKKIKRQLLSKQLSLESLNESVNDKTFIFPNLQKAIDFYWKDEDVSIETVPIKKLVDDNDLLNDDDLQSYHQRVWDNKKASEFSIDSDKINSMRLSEVPYAVRKKDGRLELGDGRHRTRALYNDGYEYLVLPVINESVKVDKIKLSQN